MTRAPESDESLPPPINILAKMLLAQKSGEYGLLPMLARKKIRERLGVEISPSSPPDEAVQLMERLKKEGLDDILLCYLPAMDIRRIGGDYNYKRPDFGFLNRGTHGNYFTNPYNEAGLLSTSAGWRIIDMRNSSGKNAAYRNDSEYLGKILSDLRASGRLTGISLSSMRDPENRNGISQAEIKKVVIPKLSERIGIDSSKVALPTLAEANLLGNIYIPLGWKYNYNGEWFDNSFKENAEYGLYGKYYRQQTTHPLSVVAIENASASSPFIGFRLQFNFQEAGAAPIGARR